MNFHLIFQNSKPFQHRFRMKGKSSKVLDVIASTKPTVSRHSPFWARSCISLFTVILKLIKVRQVRVPYSGKGKGLPQQAEVVQGVPVGLRPRIFLTFGTTRVVGRQSYTPAAFTPGEIPGTYLQRLSRPQGTWFRR
jgi:hypothetical protein